MPELINNLNRNSNTYVNTETNEYNYTIGLKRQNIEDVSNLLQNNDILDVEHYELIQNPTNDVCPITRDRFHREQNVMMICSLGIFLIVPVSIWINNHDTCPYCRKYNTK